jgi:hypothetical protein
VPSKLLRLAEIASFAEGLPNVKVGAKWNHKTWMINERGFCWERPLGKADIERLGDTPAPQGEILAIAVEDLDAKDALLAMELPGFFTIQHFNNYPAVLVELRLARRRDVKAAIEQGWRATAAKPPLASRRNKARGARSKPRARAAR